MSVPTQAKKKLERATCQRTPGLADASSESIIGEGSSVCARDLDQLIARIPHVLIPVNVGRHVAVRIVTIAPLIVAYRRLAQRFQTVNSVVTTPPSKKAPMKSCKRNWRTTHQMARTQIGSSRPMNTTLSILLMPSFTLFTYPRIKASYRNKRNRSKLHPLQHQQKLAKAHLWPQR